MKEGWYKGDYLVLFDRSEISAASDRYSLHQVLPGYEVLGLRGWDDFIVRDSSGQVHCVPTVPIDPKHLSQFSLDVEAETTVQPDARYTGKIKWYLKPLVFGGDPCAEENIIWVDHEGHAKFVKWWNELYRGMKGL